jgi:hypothetical protein
MDDAWLTVFCGTIEQRPIQAKVNATGLVRVTTTPISEISPELVKPDQELIAIELEIAGRSDLENGLRREGFSDAAVGEIMSKLAASD